MVWMRLTVLAAVAMAMGAMAAEQPATRPTVPALVVGQGTTFVMDGVVRTSPAMTLAFRVATDGERQMVAVYDPEDGTPVLMSDGEQTLVYDLAKGRVVRVPSSRGMVRVGWDPAQPKPLQFVMGVGHHTDPAKLDAFNAGFRIDQFVKAVADRLEPVESDPGTWAYRAMRPDGGEERLVIHAGNVNGGYLFTSRAAGATNNQVELRASAIGGPVRPEVVKFVDVEALRARVPVEELEGAALPGFVPAGQAGMAKMSLMAGEEGRAVLERVAPGADYDELVKRDAELGSAYRAALAEQGVQFGDEEVAATTQRAK